MLLNYEERIPEMIRELAKVSERNETLSEDAANEMLLLAECIVTSLHSYMYHLRLLEKASPEVFEYWKEEDLQIPPGPPFSKGGETEASFSKGGETEAPFSNGGEKGGLYGAKS